MKINMRHKTKKLVAAILSIVLGLTTFAGIFLMIWEIIPKYLALGWFSCNLLWMVFHQLEIAVQKRDQDDEWSEKCQDMVQYAKEESKRRV